MIQWDWIRWCWPRKREWRFHNQPRQYTQVQRTDVKASKFLLLVGLGYLVIGIWSVNNTPDQLADANEEVRRNAILDWQKFVESVGHLVHYMYLIWRWSTNAMSIECTKMMFGFGLRMLTRNRELSLGHLKKSNAIYNWWPEWSRR